MQVRVCLEVGSVGYFPAVSSSESQGWIKTGVKDTQRGGMADLSAKDPAVAAEH